MAWSGIAADVGAIQPTPNYSRDIRPILAANCFACHGPDEDRREAGLRLDVRDAAVEFMAIVPRQPGESSLIMRIFSDDPDVQMPPPDSGHALTSEQRELLKQWISDGAEYEDHWAFAPPTKSTLPQIISNTWPRNEIDYFVLAQLENEGLQPSPEADPYDLVRRVYLDLIGLPPTPEQADAFVRDQDPQAYAKLVDRLLASKNYGDHWARQWLDLARYADTNGYEKDRPRSIWPYRDWVIQALNDDMPFDQFTIEQLAGDMLPNATLQQRIATGFHRNTMINEEGGIDPLEFRFYSMVDRVATTGSVWLGLTIGCAQCHTHKYDPIQHSDYYRMMALLNNAEEPELIVRDPAILQRRAKVQQQIDTLTSELAAHFPAADGDGPIEQRRESYLEEKFQHWLSTERAKAVKWQTVRPVAMETNLPYLQLLDDGSIFSTGDITKRDEFKLRYKLDELDAPITALRLEVLPDDRLPARGPGRAYYEGRKGDFFLSEISAAAGGNTIEFASASHSYGKISIGSGNADAANVIDGEGSTGWSTAEGEGRPHQLVLILAQPLEASGQLEITMLFERHFAASLGRFRFAVTTASGAIQATTTPVDVETLLARDADSLAARDVETLRRHFLSVAPELANSREKINQIRRELPSLPTTMVLQERQPDHRRLTHRHHRGEYLSTKEQVEPGVPAFLPPLPEGAVPNRLSFARWLVSDTNPLVKRVEVNRAWSAMFGHGLVRTPGDFGTQGQFPTHPRLLDWLAVHFATAAEADGLGWSRKHLHRLIVMSATYRQSARVTPELLARDPENRVLARGPRVRVPAEVVRDSLLVASGLFSDKIGGPSVFPPQPASVTSLAYGNFDWNASTGEDRFRRSLYTFKKRTAPFAAYSVFDAPTAETCTVRRGRSNTPLQSLTMLNDAMFLEMAKALAKRAEAAADSPSSRATHIFRALLTRPPRTAELTAILAYQENQLKRLSAGELNAEAVLGEKNASPEGATWFLVARALMNLDEVITK